MANTTFRLLKIKHVSVSTLLESLWKSISPAESNLNAVDFQSKQIKKIMGRRSDDKILRELLQFLRVTQFPVTRVVVEILVKVIKRKDTFSFAFTQQILSNFGLKYCSKERGKLRVNYFMEHARLGRIMIGPMRMVEFLMALLEMNRVRVLDQNILWSLLRYGTVDLLTESSQMVDCDSLHPYVYKKTKYPRRPLIHLLIHLLQQFNKTSLPESQDMIELSDSDFELESSTRQKILKGIELVSISLRYIPKGCLTLYNGSSLREERYRGVEESHLSVALERLSRKNPKWALIERFNEGVTSLKHLCRQEIRRTLYLNWQLPTGIYMLGLNDQLAKYLDLLE